MRVIVKIRYIGSKYYMEKSYFSLTSSFYSVWTPSFEPRLKLDGIIIETTGMADPAPVAQTFFVDDEVKAFSRLDGIVTLVAALVERFDRRGTESFELFRPEFAQHSVKIQEFSLDAMKHRNMD